MSTEFIQRPARVLVSQVSARRGDAPVPSPRTNKSDRCKIGRTCTAEASRLREDFYPTGLRSGRRLRRSGIQINHFDLRGHGATASCPILIAILPPSAIVSFTHAIFGFVVCAFIFLLARSRSTTSVIFFKPDPTSKGFQL